VGGAVGHLRGDGSRQGQQGVLALPPGCADSAAALAIGPRANGPGPVKPATTVGMYGGEVGGHGRFPPLGALCQVSGEPSVPSRMRRSVRTRLLRERTSAGRSRTSLLLASRPRRPRGVGAVVLKVSAQQPPPVKRLLPLGPGQTGQLDSRLACSVSADRLDNSIPPAVRLRLGATASRPGMACALNRGVHRPQLTTLPNVPGPT
jgi:hypothetical protein